MHAVGETGKLIPDGTYLQARRGDLTMEINTSTAGVDAPGGTLDVNATITRIPPRSAAVMALLGWLVLGWASRRTEHAGVPVRFLTREPVVIAMAVMVPLWLGGASGFVDEALRLGTTDQPFWTSAVTWGYGYALFAGTLCLLALIVASVAGLPSPRRPAGPPARRPGRSSVGWAGGATGGNGRGQGDRWGIRHGQYPRTPQRPEQVCRTVQQILDQWLEVLP